MPQSTYMPLYAASYPILAKAQKPGGVTVLSAVTGGDVPNKPTYAAGTIQMASFEGDEEGRSLRAGEENGLPHTQEEVEEEILEEEDQGPDTPTRGRRGRRR